MWGTWWPKSPNPHQFWYLYPDKNVATSEFQNKWVPEFMPKTGVFVNTPFKEKNVNCLKYGWRAYYEKRKIDYIEFESGVRIYFKTYAQDVHSLQSGSCHYITCDEELPTDLLSELQARLYSTKGYFDMVFTATRNQELWWMAIEAKGDLEKFKDAYKVQIEMYDCLEYMDGTPGHFTIERIKEIEAGCKSDIEIQRRVRGRFVSEIGRKYPAFDPTKHYCAPFEIPKSYKIYAGVDIGSGGLAGHPSAICFLAVTPDCRKGYFFKGDRMDGIPTTAGDTLLRFIELRGRQSMTLQTYDPSCADFGTIATRSGEPFIKAEKSHELGEQVINTLFKNNMLYIFDTPDMVKMGGEFLRVMTSTAKNKCNDDFIDAGRYAAVLVPWDWTAINGELSDGDAEQKDSKELSEKELKEWNSRQRRGLDPRQGKKDSWSEFMDNINYWNDQYG